MHTAHVRTNLLQRRDWVTRTVEDHIRWIEIDEQIVAFDIVDESQECLGRFLTCFQMQSLVVDPTMFGQFLGYIDDCRVSFRMFVSVWYEAQMQPDDSAIQQVGEVANLLHFPQSNSSCFVRNQADGPLRRWNVGVTLTVEPAKDGRQTDAQTGNTCKEVVGMSLGSNFFAGGVQLDCGNAQVAGDFQRDAQTGINTGKNADLPNTFIHHGTCCLLFGVSQPSIRPRMRLVGYLIVIIAVRHHRQTCLSDFNLFHSWFRSHDASRRLDWLLAVWIPLTLVQFAMTARLWTSQLLYPQIPLFAVGIDLPPGLDRIAFGLLLGAMVVTGVARACKFRRLMRWAPLLGTVALALLFIADQHRLQPWAYLSVLILLVIGLAEDDVALPLLRLLLISVYLHSAISKLDFEFMHSTGPQFLDALLPLIGTDGSSLGWHSRVAFAAAFPGMELLMGFGLLIPRIRNTAVVLGIAMHIGLLIVLGPWGLGHHPTVLVWNLVCGCLLAILFWPFPPRGSEPVSGARRPLRILEKSAVAIIWLVLLLPFLEPYGRFDHWPAWGLYAPRNSRAAVFIDQAVAGRLPTEVRRYLVPPKFNDPEFTRPVQYLNLNRMSLDQLRVPVYPQDRFQLGVAIWVAEQYQLGDSIHVELLSSSARMDGVRSATLLSGERELLRAAEQFRLNAFPRRIANE